MGGSGTGNTSLLVFGGNPGKKANTESWDGSSWTERNDLSTAREGNGGFGTSTTSAIYAGGQDATTYTAVSEEFSSAGATASLQNLGQVFYNSTSDAFKVTQQPVPGGTWAVRWKFKYSQNIFWCFWIMDSNRFRICFLVV
jgi:hypothetical protein